MLLNIFEKIFCLLNLRIGGGGECLLDSSRFNILLKLIDNKNKNNLM